MAQICESNARENLGSTGDYERLDPPVWDDGASARAGVELLVPDVLGRM